MRKGKKRNSDTKREVSEIALLQEMTRLLQILVRVNLRAMRGDRTQADMIVLLDSVGCGHAEIAQLLGVTSNSVGPTLSRARKKK